MDWHFSKKYKPFWKPVRAAGLKCCAVLTYPYISNICKDSKRIGNLTITPVILQNSFEVSWKSARINWKDKVTTNWFCNFLGNQLWALKMTTDWFWNFLGNQHLSQLKTQSHYKLFFQFSWKPAPTQPQLADNVYSLVYKFLGQNWMGTFKKPSHYRLVL